MRMTRRTVLVSGFATAIARTAEQPKSFPPEWARFSDPATEWEVFRLTGLGSGSHLPFPYGRVISRHGVFLLFWSDRTGSAQAFQFDLRTGAISGLTSAAALDGSSLTLMPDDHSFCCFDGDTLSEIHFTRLHQREICTVSQGWKRTPGFSISRDGTSAVFGESKGEGSRLRLVGIRSRRESMVSECPFLLSDPQPNPRRTQILYRQGSEALWLVNFDGRDNRKLRTAPGAVGPAFWRSDGRTVLYLSFPEEKSRLIEIREHTPDENADKLVAPTSQFVTFSANSDASVFAGASRNLNSPHILILLRMTRRELTVCEHHASDPRQVTPIFSPDNRFLFFESDREGKPAIYRVRVERFVEPAEDQT